MPVFTHFWCREKDETLKSRFQELPAVSLQVYVQVVGIYCRYYSFQTHRSWKNAAFWNVTSCSLSAVYCCFGRTCCLHIQTAEHFSEMSENIY
jgi:hypothetical protein